MINSRITFTISFGLMALLGLMAPRAHAQQLRARTLEYDPAQREWVEKPPPTPGTAEADLQDITQKLKRRQFRRARSSVARFIKKYGDNHPLYAKALLADVQAQMGRRNYYKAHLALLDFQGRFGDSALIAEAQRLDYLIAETYLGGVKRKLWGLRLFSGEDTALKVLDALSIDRGSGRLAELSYKTKGDYFFALGEHALAELEYSQLLRDFPHGRYHQFASRRTADAAVASFGGVEYDEAALIEADERFRDYRKSYPVAADADEVNIILDDIREKRADKEFVIGQYYERTSHLSSAIYYYKMVRTHWPDSLAAIKATARLEILGVLQPVARQSATGDAIAGGGTSR